MKRSLPAAFVAVACLLAAPSAFAAHESNNVFDLKPTAAGPAGADGAGSSNYLKGYSDAKGVEVWNSHVSVSGLAPGTLYTFYAENATGSVQTAVCSFTTDAGGDGSCRRNKHEEPSFAAARIRPGSGTGNTAPAVLMATGAEVGDPDNKVEDGEIERYGDCRSPDQMGETCNAPGQG